jgi:ribosomal protein S27AE
VPGRVGARTVFARHFLGLMPSDTGAPGGKRTGQRVSHYVIPDGAFAHAFAARKFAVPYYDRAGESGVTRKKRKVAYTCPSCDDKVWGKPDVQPHCGKCGLVAMIASYDTNTADLAGLIRAGPAARWPPPSRDPSAVALPKGAKSNGERMPHCR